LTTSTAREESADMTSQVGYDFSLFNKVAVVTGGTSGIASVIVRRTPPMARRVVVLVECTNQAADRSR
jgi:hypothetical protein